MPSLPVSLSVGGRLCLVIGAGELAKAKIDRLLRAGARVRVVDAEIDAELEARAAREPALSLVARSYQTEDLEGCWLAFLAVTDAELRARVVRDAERARIWLNAVDVPEACSFVMPAILERGRITIAVGTGGASPLLARVLRDRIGDWLGDEYAAAADHLARLREKFAPGAARQRAFGALLDAGLLEALRQGDRMRVDDLTRSAFAGLPAREDAAADAS
jgi:precorrin-2 dehydrogenase/sirohydrochlorin ferrochelatase